MTKDSGLSKTIVFKSLTDALQLQQAASAICSRIAVVDLSYVVSFFHLHLAVYKALLNETQGHMKTTSIASEVLYSLSPSTEISEAIEEYSITEKTTSVAFILIDSPEGSAEACLPIAEFRSHILRLCGDGDGKGIEVDPEEISASHCLTPEKESRIAEHFNISVEELKSSDLEECMANRLTAKG